MRRRLPGQSSHVRCRPDADCCTRTCGCILLSEFSCGCVCGSLGAPSVSAHLYLTVSFARSRLRSRDRAKRKMRDTGTGVAGARWSVKVPVDMLAPLFRVAAGRWSSRLSTLTRCAAEINLCAATDRCSCEVDGRGRRPAATPLARY